MKKIMIVLLAVTAIGGTTIPVSAQNSCGFKPFPPFGCKNARAVCRCDSNGCEWIWYCD